MIAIYEHHAGAAEGSSLMASRSCSIAVNDSVPSSPLALARRILCSIGSRALRRVGMGGKHRAETFVLFLMGSRCCSRAMKDSVPSSPLPLARKILESIDLIA